MKSLFFAACAGVALFLAPNTYSAEQSVLARVTAYWRGEGSGERAAWNGAWLRNGHCAVDPGKIPYGSTILFPDAECVAVDTGPAVVSRRSARLSGRTTAQKSALVIDRFFESKHEALAWCREHPHFIKVRVVERQTAGTERRASHAQAAIKKFISAVNCDRLISYALFPEENVPLLPGLEARNVQPWAAAALSQ